MNDIIGFYSKVFEQELSKSSQLHLYSKKIVKKLFLSGNEEVITGEHPCVPISDTKALSFIKEIELNGTDLELKYFSGVRLSRFTSFSKYEVTRAYPLLSYNANLDYKDDNYYLDIKIGSRSILKDNLKSRTTGLMDFQALAKEPISDFHFMSMLADQLSKDENNDSDDLRLFPKLFTDRKIKGKMSLKTFEKDLFLPCGVLCLVEKPKYSFSSLEELKLIEKVKSFSKPLNVLFGNADNSLIEKEGVICEELNFWQQQAVENSNSKVVSSISGPPGTGKSFTISNIAAEKVSKGQTVLISSKNQEALDVIDQKIKDNLGIDNLTVNPSQSNNLSELKDHLKFILGHKFKGGEFSDFVIENSTNLLKKKIRALKRFEKEIEHTFELEKNVLNSLNTSEFTKDLSTSFKKRIIKSRGIKTIPLWIKLLDYYNKIEETRILAVEVLKATNSYRLKDSVYKNRKHLRDYLKFLKAREPKRKQDLLKDLDHTAILNTFPVWLAKASEVAKIFPRNREMFDFVIIDEASQCDIPSIIPLLQRAKKCIVVGDLNQLGHISFIPKVFEAKLKSQVIDENKYLCKHRDYSLLALVNDVVDPQDISYLSEHFRSKHAIIEFSNKAIYNNQLEILTKRPTLAKDAVEFIKVDGQNKKSLNVAEIEQIIEKVTIIVQKEAELPQKLKTTLGILSPFRNQVDKLFVQVKKSFTLKQIKAHRIMVGTAFSFQGNERDMMLLSLVADDKSPAGSYNYINRKDVFNVSVTRARTKQLVYYSFDPKQLKFESTLDQFFDFYDKYQNHKIEAFDKNEFCSEIEDYISQFGYQTWQQFTVSGVNVDVLAQKNDNFIAIDLVGFPGEVGDFYTLERYKMLERGNIKLFPLPYAYWLYDKEFCLKAIEAICK